MALAERSSDLALNTETDTVRLPLALRLLPLRGLLRQLEIESSKKQNLERLERIKNAVTRLSAAAQDMTASTTEEAQKLLRQTGNLLADHTVMTNRKEAFRVANLQYEKQIYPLGVTSELLVQTAPAYRFIHQEGGLEMVELNPATLEPLSPGPEAANSGA
jgi:hypothetical protein